MPKVLDALPPPAVGPEVKGVSLEVASGHQEIRRSAKPSHMAQDRGEEPVRVVNGEAESAAARAEPTGHAQQPGQDPGSQHSPVPPGSTVSMCS